MIKKVLLAVVMLLAVSQLSAQGYKPTAENIKAREEFADARFGIFIHWGIYSMFAQGEWYMQNAGLNRDEYAKAADAFYPHRFNAEEWVKAIKGAGAKYICFTTRHHDGFSMWDTEQSEFNIVDATPFGRDIVKELAEACQKHGIKLHFYYSHIDWLRDDYPRGRTARNVTGRDETKIDWAHYYDFMNRQVTELLTNYGPIGAIWFDGLWDHDEDVTPFNWQLEEQYAMIHKLQPSCLIANNHHITPFEGEDIQIFERDLPGENTHGLSGQDISPLPLETCQTMNGMWGYKIIDQNYKSAETLIRYLVSAAGKGANLLLNVGPQPNGELPAAALERMKAMGEWLAVYGKTIYNAEAGDVKQQQWGCTTRHGEKLYVHIFELEDEMLYLPLECKVADAKVFVSGEPVKVERVAKGVVLNLGKIPQGVDYVVELTTK